MGFPKQKIIPFFDGEKESKTIFDVYVKIELIIIASWSGWKFISKSRLVLKKANLHLMGKLINYSNHQRLKSNYVFVAIL